MRLRIIQGGQTGVDRGAWRGAIECGLARGGWMPHDMRDEHGPIPSVVAADLRRHAAGKRDRTLANIAAADAVLVVVADATRGCVTPGTRLTWRQAGIRHKERLVVDGSHVHTSRIAPWLRVCAGFDGPSSVPFGLMIAGPRASLWPEGGETARRIVHAIAEACRG